MRYILVVLVLFTQSTYSMLRVARCVSFRARHSPSRVRYSSAHHQHKRTTPAPRATEGKKLEHDLVRQAQLIDMHARLRVIENRRDRPGNFLSMLGGMGIYAVLTYAFTKLGIDQQHVVGSSIFGGATCSACIRALEHRFRRNQDTSDLKKEIKKFEEGFQDKDE